MNTRYKKHLEAFKNTVVSVVSSDDGITSGLMQFQGEVRTKN